MLSQDEIYIDYISLTHSNTNGNISPLCRTLSPTISPSMSPTISPTVDSTIVVKGTSLLTIKNLSIAITLLIIILIILAVSIYLLSHRYLVNKYKKEVVIENAMVILLAIGEYDNDTMNNCKPVDNMLKNVYL
eukprot:331133_1